ncbi:MAG: SWIM zinc finger family protein [Verrucomicrobiota bacterium]|nr:SWIM zinc finger family protein [Verrucomicrobiota bacterium]
MSWTIEQALALAPDPASAKAGQGLSSPRKWQSLGRNGNAVWGLCQGSGADPYQARIDLSEPAFKCSCPSRKFPCKHGLGLLLIFIQNPQAVVEGEPPPWVTEWMQSRQARAEKAAAKAEVATEPPADPEAVAAAAAKRAQKREERVADGLAEMELWLRDTVRTGLASAQAQSSSFWENKAARLVDAQAPGVARRVRELATLCASGTGWQERVLGELARLYLLRRAAGRLEYLPEPERHLVRNALGWTTKTEDVIQSGAVEADWFATGQRVEEDERLATRRTWMLKDDGAQWALLLQFAPHGQPLKNEFPAPRAYHGALSYYPGSLPLRAVPSGALNHSPLVVPGGESISTSLNRYAGALARDPWLEQWPMLLGGVIPCQHEGLRWLRDSSGDAIPVAMKHPRWWTLLSISGGDPVTVFGEWTGEFFWPLTVFTDQQSFTLGNG